MLDRIKSLFRQFILERETPKNPTPRRLTGFENARSIGILFHADNESIVYDIENFARKLSGQNKQVDVIGYCHTKVIPDYCKKMTIDFFCKKSVNWLGIPSKSVTGDFMKKNWDILLTLSKDNMFPLVYLAVVCDATLKIGYHTEENQKIFDFMLKTDARLGAQDFFEQTDYYLQMLNQNKYAPEY